MSNVTAIPSFFRSSKAPRVIAALAMVLGMFAPLSSAMPSYASTVSSAAFTGGTGTVNVGGTLYAKNGGALTLTVNTSSDTKCVDVSGAFTGHLDTSTARSIWIFSFTAGQGDGVQSVTVTTRPGNTQQNCAGQPGTGSASYILDNTGPVVTAALSPAPNAAGWNNSNVSITWSASDAGSGVASGPTPTTDSQQQNTADVTKTATATDRLGNVGNGSVTVKLDKTAPTITGSRSPAANANGWNNTDVTVSFSCSDSPSGIKSCTGPTTLSSSAANQSVPGTAVDNADNSASATVSGINIDKVAPALSGAPTTSANGAGWYNGNVTIHWTASDALSGLQGSAPADSTISSEGTGLTAPASVSDKAGNTTGATSSPAVNIDKTAPNTTATAPADWNNNDVTVSLIATDALSGVAATYYTLDGGTQQTGTSVAISAEGIHTLQFWSVDNAGNTETAKSVQVKIDLTPPTINHTQSPATNPNGWNNGNVTVTFTCGDTGGSGIASCTAPQTVTTEGKDQAVTGTATDHAGNTATDPATVSIDKTAPTISAAADRAANGNGWYNADVTVGFNCGDALSGVSGCPASQTLGEGANQSANGTATDAAGNTASAGVSGINVDETAPSLSGAATTAPNGNGWYSGDVTVHWTTSDVLSGLAGSSPADSTITGEGDNLSASASVSDLAGNSTSTTVSGIKIDRAAPSTLASVPDPLASGWYAGDVLVTLTTGADLSGVDKTYYSVDGGAAEEYTAPFNHTLKGSHTITFWSVDNAGNVEDNAASGHSITLKIDGVPPTISGSRVPVANGFGWSNGPVTVSFNCSDAESGIAGCSDPVTLNTEGAGQSVLGLAQDNAGNTNSATVSDIDIDLTAPTLTGAATTSPNAFGWYKGNVTIHWTGQDGLSGIDPATQPVDSTITGEGSNLGAGPVSISDQAGNIGSGSVSGIKIDRTAPTISGAATTQPNPAGWYHSGVTVHFSATDPNLADSTPGSGVAGQPDDVRLESNGAGQSASSGAVSDLAGNTASSIAVAGISIDTQPPNVVAAMSCTGRNGYCRGGSATVNLTATDQNGLSGVKGIYSRVGTSGNFHYDSGAAATVQVPLSGNGQATVQYYALDNADNQSAQDGVSLRYDTIAPSVLHSLSTAANADGWNNSDVTVNFLATDQSDGSGVELLKIDGATVATASATPAPLTMTASKAINTETGTNGQSITSQAEDAAGNSSNLDSVIVKLDKTAPTIQATVTGQMGNNGWYKSAVTVHYICNDSLSGIAACPADDVATTQGTNPSFVKTVSDRAGNTGSVTVPTFNIDSTAPAITINGIADGGIYLLGAVPAASCTATDSTSGVASCSISAGGGTGIGVGTFAFTATATDNAGNTSTQTGSYGVHYRFDGFLQPINDVPHNPGQTLSVFRAGSTIPVKFQLKRADGTPVQASTTPLWLTPLQGNVMTLPVDETQYSDPGDTAYRWDPTAQQYIFNYHTASNQGGKSWRLFARLDDGQTVYVDVALR